MCWYCFWRGQRKDKNSWRNYKKNRTRVEGYFSSAHFFPDASQTFPTINKAHNKIKQTPKRVPYCLLWCNTWNKYLRFLAYLFTHGLFPSLKLKVVLKDVKSCMTPLLHLKNWTYFLQGQDVAGTAKQDATHKGWRKVYKSHQAICAGHRLPNRMYFLPTQSRLYSPTRIQLMR